MDVPVAILGGTDSERDQLAAFLVSAGLPARGAQRLSSSDGFPPLIIITGDNVAELVAEARSAPALAEVAILAVVPAVPATWVANALAAGATDVMRKPVSSGLLVARCRNLMRATRKDIGSTLARINDVLVQHGDDAEALVQVLTLTAGALGFERASLVAHIDGSDHAFVIAASDAEPMSRFTLAIAEYPELVAAMRSGLPEIVEDVSTHPTTSAIARVLEAHDVRANAVFPVQWRNRSLGAILLRKRTPGAPQLTSRGIELGKLIASMVAAHLRHGSVLESLRDQTHRISRVRYEAERRLRGIDSLKEHFEAGADGVVVLDDAGRILFVNRAAERITGFARDGMLGSELVDLLPMEQRPNITDAIARVLAGVNADAFDLQLSTTSGSPVWVSATTSTVLAGTGAVILGFRDVTAERALEHELRATTEFLERLIDSTVDAI
ncbi:MAG TPA: PAS domain-containing protein, partial [Kofleriaceae bacterium]